MKKLSLMALVSVLAIGSQMEAGYKIIANSGPKAGKLIDANNNATTCQRNSDCVDAAKNSVTAFQGYIYCNRDNNTMGSSTTATGVCSNQQGTPLSN